MRRRYFIPLLLTGFAVVGCDSATTQPITRPKPVRPTAAELDQQTFARHAAALRDVYHGYEAELNTLTSITPSLQNQPTPSTKISPADFDHAHTIAQASTKILSDLDNAARKAGNKPNGIPGDNELHDELEPAAFALEAVKLHTAHLAANLREAHRTPGYRYMSQTSVLTAQHSLTSAREALTQTYSLLDQPTTARGLSLEAL